MRDVVENLTSKIATKYENQIKITNSGDFGKAEPAKEKSSTGGEAGGSKVRQRAGRSDDTAFPGSQPKLLYQFSLLAITNPGSFRQFPAGILLRADA
jgi:hypothetical protein